jgi:hypothetical protein
MDQLLETRMFVHAGKQYDTSISFVTKKAKHILVNPFDLEGTVLDPA